MYIEKADARRQAWLDTHRSPLKQRYDVYLSVSFFVRVFLKQGQGCAYLNQTSGYKHLKMEEEFAFIYNGDRAGVVTFRPTIPGFIQVSFLGGVDRNQVGDPVTKQVTNVKTSVFLYGVDGMITMPIRDPELIQEFARVFASRTRVSVTAPGKIDIIFNLPGHTGITFMNHQNVRRIVMETEIRSSALHYSRK
jgi:hypothetical protein